MHQVCIDLSQRLRNDMNHTFSLHILVVEDNDSLREATVDFLTAHGHMVTGVVSAEEVADTPTWQIPDLYLIDVNLPGENGFVLAERIRRSQPQAGIVLMTARGQLHDRLEGYACGADNYLVKPVETAELLACIQNLGRRLQAKNSQAAVTLALGAQLLWLKGPSGQVTLTPGEGRLLAGLIRAAGQQLERWQAMQLIDPDDKGLVAANLEMRISALRKKLSACGAPEDAIRTLRGFGYALHCPVQIV